MEITFDPSLQTPVFAQPPSDYSASMEAAAPGTTAIIAQTQTPGESWTDTLQRVLPSLVAGYQQKQFLNMNLDRARQGLPPLDASQFGVGVSVGLSPELKQMLILGALGIGALLLLRR